MNMLNDYYKILSEVLKIVHESKVCPETTLNEWAAIILFMHLKGWLYIQKDINKIDLVVGAYRVKDYDKNIGDVLPLKEEGDILYVAFMVSFSKDKLKPRRLFNDYLKENPNIKELIFFKDRNNKNFKSYKRRVKDVKTKESELTSCSNLSS